MKKIIFALSMLFALSMEAQTTIDVVEVKKDSTILYQFKERTLRDGREVAFRLFPETPLPKDSFGLYVFKMTIPMHQAVQQAHAVIREQEASIGILSGYVDTLLGDGAYAYLYEKEVVSSLNGSWTLLTLMDDKIVDGVTFVIKDGLATSRTLTSTVALDEKGVSVGKGIFEKPVVFSFQDGVLAGSLNDKKYILKQ